MSPFLKIIIPFMVGIMFRVETAHLCSLPRAWLIIAALATTPWCALSTCRLAGLAKSLRSIRSIRSQGLYGLYGLHRPISELSCFLPLIAMMIQGMLAWEMMTTKAPLPNGEQVYAGMLEAPPTQNQRSASGTLKLQAIWQEGQWHPCRQKVRLYLLPGVRTNTLREGNILVFRGQPQRMQHTADAEISDFEHYLLRQEIHYTLFLREHQWMVVCSNGYSFPRNIAVNLRYKILEHWERFALGDDEHAVAVALTLGYKSTLSRRIRDEYAAAGIAHILALSGLHAGLLYLLLSVCIPRGHASKTLKGCRSLFIIGVLWLFVLMSGCSPSIVRAVLMLSLAEAGRAYHRPGNGWNYLAASAFAILFLAPEMMHNLGFRMSYAAVGALLAFMVGTTQKPPASTRARFLNRLKQMMQVSLVAQAGTSPLSVYHFQQFPLLFPLANLIAVPLCGLILCTSLMVLALSFLPQAGHWMAWILSLEIKGLNTLAASISALPHATLHNISITTTQVYVAYISLGALAVFRHTKAYMALCVCMVGLCLLLLL